VGLQHLSRELILRESSKAARLVMDRCDELGAISDEEGRLTRTFHLPAMQRVNALTGSWMRAAGLEVWEDAAFNIFGRWKSPAPRARTLLLGSHLDTVRDAGKYDGPLGVLVALAAVSILRAPGGELPFSVEIVGFSDEEGTRYQTTYLGSRAVAGTLRTADLAVIEEKGIARARRGAREFLAYIEVHIEQGPMLESAGMPLGVVSGIGGQSRVRLEFVGRAGHAGTTPMAMRRDALCAAAEFVLAVERCGITATVGEIEVEPGASNVIPARVVMSLDARDLSDARRRRAISQLRGTAAAIARRRGLQVKWKAVQETATVRCDAQLRRCIAAAVRRQQGKALVLPSGAGHDAAAIAALCPMAMLFVRCRRGISHHPDESVKAGDVAQAIAALCDVILQLKKKHG
jgi:allantoate deiminase